MTTLPAVRRHGGNYCLPGTIKQGYLTKSPPLEKRSLMKNWKKRWCILVTTSKDVCLDYYHNEAETNCGLPIKRVNLTKCFKVEMDLEHSNYKHVFAIHLPQRVFYFAAPSDFEMREWADALCANLKLKKSSSSETNAGFLSPPRYPQGMSPPVKERLTHSLDRPSSPQQLMNYASPPLFHRTVSPGSCSLPPELRSPLSQQTPPPLPPWNGTFTTQVQDEGPPPPPPPRTATPTPSTSDDKSSFLRGTTPPPPPLRLPAPSPPESPSRSPTPPIARHDEISTPPSSQLTTPPPLPPHHKRSIPSSPEPLTTDPVLSPSLLSMPPPLPPRREVLRQSGLTSVVNVNGSC